VTLVTVVNVCGPQHSPSNSIRVVLLPSGGLKGDTAHAQRPGDSARMYLDDEVARWGLGWWIEGRGCPAFHRFPKERSITCSSLTGSHHNLGALPVTRCPSVAGKRGGSVAGLL
jgi:hypothetical protein